MQTPTQNMLEHGHAVHRAYHQLTLNPPAELTWLLPHLPDPKTLYQYHIYHDCGKHLALTIDETGRRQYPGHAQKSYEQYLAVFPDDTKTAELILHDMDFHTMKGQDLLDLCSKPYAAILYTTAWAELEANAQMFGGRDTESYKIKRSRLIQAGKKLRKYL